MARKERRRRLSGSLARPVENRVDERGLYNVGSLKCLFLLGWSAFAIDKCTTRRVLSVQPRHCSPVHPGGGWPMCRRGAVVGGWASPAASGGGGL
jgi:hypothetical protein